jgi:TRIAD3 protein (E3 ubiquitin-protein ligase RNF216)
MTAALVQVCNKCKKEFLKEDGCNKMKCPCGNSQCYICSKNVDDYGHFDLECPLYESNEEAETRLKLAVGVAQRQAVRDVLKARGDISKKDITVDGDLMGKSDPRNSEDEDFGAESASDNMEAGFRVEVFPKGSTVG